MRRSTVIHHDDFITVRDAPARRRNAPVKLWQACRFVQTWGHHGEDGKPVLS